ncbi:hypothetical protein MICA_824 [Micavibrio aeruginosavorus ARL-13]|uniref:Uncharacterized protein n=1 Tax=Micavibrio aeruginosavorus (strain ARL-13) TaxID=856793 RepID=G2KRB0_MICAA|nr:hypothetical protein MICA_824 [Micavibrio aeruginosavorus ARL-13]
MHIRLRLRLLQAAWFNIKSVILIITCPRMVKGAWDTRKYPHHPTRHPGEGRGP